jgi:uncharacterized protein (DUF2236 family)
MSRVTSRAMSGFAGAVGGANIVMQLSRLPIGHGVLESKVDSGAVTEHPVKRARTTLGYVTIALFGTDHERAVMRDEVNRQHRMVRSTGPVAYNAFDPELQLCVAACMYRGVVDAITFLYGTPDEDALDELYGRCSRFGTTLQMPESMWPADRTAFDEYWDASLQHVEMDDATRRYLYDFASLQFLPGPLRWTLGPPHRFITAGFLPAPFRKELGLSWSGWHEALFKAFTMSAAATNRVLPRPAREFPWNVYLWDTRRRIRDGRAIV